MKNLLDAIWQFCRFLFLTPSWGSKKRRAQQEYEERLDKAMSESDNQ